MSGGFIYALINPSLEGLIKVGRTDRTPDERAREISASTGVPTPFVVAYERHVSNSIAAEGFVHAFLEKQGVRVSDNREFFRAPLTQVINAILAFQDSATVGQEQSNDPSSSPSKLDMKEQLTEEFLSVLAGDTEHNRFGLVDHQKALSIADQMVRLGIPYGNKWRGLIFINHLRNGKKAEQAFRDGANAGDFPCLLDLLAFMDVQTRRYTTDHLWAQACTQIQTYYEETFRRIVAISASPEETQWRMGRQVMLDLAHPWSIHLARRRQDNPSATRFRPWLQDPSLIWLREAIRQKYAQDIQEAPGQSRLEYYGLEALDAP